MTLNLDNIDDGSTRKLADYLPLSGGSVTGTLSAAQLSANIIETGTGDNNYFQSRKFRGEGNAATYYHAIDFGFAGHNQVDFYEYGGLWNFWKNTNATATTDSSNLCLQIGDTYVKNKGNTFTWPTTSGTVALKEDTPTATESATTGITVSAALAANPSFTGTAHTHTITDNGHTHTYEKAKVTDANKTDVVKSASFAATYDANNHRRSFGFTATNTKVLTGIGYESAVATSKATTGIAVGSTTAGGTVSKPNINVTVTDPGHTHGI